MQITPSEEQSRQFFAYLDTWASGLTTLTFEELVAEAGGAEHIGIFSVDVINGFCHEGPLRSDRVQGIVAPIAALLVRAQEAGVSHFVFAQDTHSPQAAEFADYPPHCIAGTSEAQMVPELATLPFASQFHIVPKNCVHSAVGTELNAWLDAHPEVTHRIVVGDCTDICTYHLALHLKFRANAADRHDPVYLPLDCVNTYDVPVEVAEKVGIPAHPAEIFHSVFLYSLATNGIRIHSHIA